MIGPPPAMMKRTLDRSNASKSGWRSMSASCVGTPATVVMLLAGEQLERVVRHASAP